MAFKFVDDSAVWDAPINPNENAKLFDASFLTLFQELRSSPFPLLGVLGGFARLNIFLSPASLKAQRSPSIF